MVSSIESYKFVHSIKAVYGTPYVTYIFMNRIMSYKFIDRHPVVTTDRDRACAQQRRTRPMALSTAVGGAAGDDMVIAELHRRHTDGLSGSQAVGDTVGTGMAPAPVDDGWSAPFRPDDGWGSNPNGLTPPAEATWWPELPPVDPRLLSWGISRSVSSSTQNQHRSQTELCIGSVCF